MQAESSITVQDHYFMMKPFRYFFSALFIALGMCLIIVAISTNSILVIVFEIVFCVIGLPLIIYVAASRKIRVTSEGLYYSKFLNPFKPLFIDWNNIQRISTLSSYHIVGTDTQILATFSHRIEKFEQLLDSFRAKNISIDRKKLKKIPQPDSSLEDNGFLTSSSAPPRLYQHKGLVVGLLIAGILITILITFFILCFVVFGAVNSLLSIIWLFMTVWFLDLVLNGFIRIRLEGIDVPKMFARREVILWTEIPYVKLFETKFGSSQTYMVIKLFAKSKDDFVASVIEGSQAWEPLLRELKSLNIPILSETEQFNPSALRN